jgi:hypothetical protein
MAVNEKSRNLCQSNRLSRDLPGNVVLKGLQRHEAFFYSHFSYGRGPFPADLVWDAENRNLRQLPWHRHRLVQMRTGVMNQLHLVALNEGDCTYSTVPQHLFPIRIV